MSDKPTIHETPDKPSHFIAEEIQKDLEAGRVEQIVTRFPPEPNGYLHIGHAKAITIDFTMADQFGGTTNLRMDDTNPVNEDTTFIEAIKEDIRWLGFDWERFTYASDNFEKLYEMAEGLVEKGLAYVDHLSMEEIRAYRGSLTEPGKASPYRDRSVEENLSLLRSMRAGEFPDGTCVLRARIDMASPNLNLRDPVLYRIKHAHHHRTGDAWCLYPTYDYAHGQCDALEGVTHSLCSLEFEDHRPLYNWLIEKLELFPSRQIEFARLNLTYTVMSKRKLRELVEKGHVNGWDDPRMPTLSGLRRKGYPPEAIRNFLGRVGVTKYNSLTDLALLEHCVREELNRTAPRFMAVLDPLEVIIDNYPEEQVEQLEAVNNPEDPAAGTRQIPFSRRLYVERADFKEDAPRKFYRLTQGREVRLRWGYFITCQSLEKNAEGNVIRLRCTYDPETKGGNASDGRKVKATLHWVSADHAVELPVRLYDNLFTKENPNALEEGEDWLDFLNPDSQIETTAQAEPSLADLSPRTTVQFERTAYFTTDSKDSTPGKPVFNRTATLRGSKKF